MGAKDTEPKEKASGTRKKKRTPAKVEQLDPPLEQPAGESTPADISQEIPAAPLSNTDEVFDIDDGDPEQGDSAPEESPFIVTELPAYPVGPTHGADAAPAPPERKSRLPFSKNGHKSATTMCKAIVFVRYPFRNWYFTQIEQTKLHERGITPVKNGRGGWIYPVVVDRDGNWTNWPRLAVPLMASAHALYKATHWPQHKTIAKQANQKWQKATTIGIVVVIVLLFILIFLLMFFFFFLK